MLVDPDAVVLPTSKSDGAARLGMLPQDSEDTTVDKVDDSSDDLDKFSDINSQDDALTRQEKERKQSLLRKSMSTLVSGANTMI